MGFIPSQSERVLAVWGLPFNNSHVLFNDNPLLINIKHHNPHGFPARKPVSKPNSNLQIAAFLPDLFVQLS